MNIDFSSARRWSSGPFEASQVIRFNEASPSTRSQQSLEADDELELVDRCPLLSAALSHVPGLKVEDARVLQFYDGGDDLAAFVCGAEQLQLLNADSDRAMVRKRIVREVLQKSIGHPGFYQSVLAEIRSRPSGCSDHYDVLLDDLDRLLRLGAVESPSAAARTVLREVCLKQAMHVACELGGDESLTTYGVLASAFDDELEKRLGSSGSIFQAPRYAAAGAIAYPDATRRAREFLDAEAASGYPLTRQEAAHWPAWMAYTDSLPDVQKQVRAIEARALAQREAVAGDTEAEYEVVLDRDERIAAVRTAVIASLLKSRKI